METLDDNESAAAMPADDGRPWSRRSDKNNQMVSVDSKPDSLSMSDFVNINTQIFQTFPSDSPRPGCTLLKTLKPGALQKWCKDNGNRPNVWCIDKATEAEDKLRIFPYISYIVEKIEKANVTVLISPTGSGKTVVGPLLLVELLNRSREGERYKGLTISPSTDQAKRMAKWAEEMYMTNSDAYCEIVNFGTPFHRVDNENIAKNVRNSPKHAVTNHRGGLIGLGNDTKLKLLIIDEAHSTNPNILLLLARARRLLHSGNVEKLVICSATLDEKEIESLKSYFAKVKLTTEVVDLTEQLEPNRRGLKMSCAELGFNGFNKGDFEETRLSKALTEDFVDKENAFHTMSISYYNLMGWFNDEEVEEEEKEERPEFGAQEGHWNYYREDDDPWQIDRAFIPEMNDMMPFVKQTVERGMECATEKLEEMLKQKADATMPSFLVILPGREHIDRMKCSLERTLEHMELEEKEKDDKKRKKKLRGLKLDSKHFKNYMYKDTKEPAFIVERFDSNSYKCAIDGNDKLDEEKLEKNELKKELKGPWGGKKGRIILCTPQAAEGLTLNDVFLVIDSGVVRINAAYSMCGLRSLDLKWMDKRMLLQRAGRCGRTMEGEFFLCASGRKVAKVLKADYKSLFMEREFDESAWLRAKQMKLFDELIWRPPKSLTDRYEISFTIRGLVKEGKFTEEVNLLYQYFADILTPEQARFVVMGVRLGLAAHVICYVADTISSHKICGRPTKIAKNWKAIGESDAYEMFVNVSAKSTFEGEEVRPYDIGDSVAKADLIVTWLRHLFPTDDDDDDEREPNLDVHKSYDDEKWKEMQERAAKTADGIFWSGGWCKGKGGGEKKDAVIGMKKMQEVMIRDEGRSATIMIILQIIRACQRLDIISARDPSQGRGNFLSPRFNRYLRGKENFNLNDDGRALFRALLTMSSDKMARACFRVAKVQCANGPVVKKPVWKRFKIIDYGRHIYPERRDWNERDSKPTTKYVRYWDGFMATHGGQFIGSCDPLTTAQAAFFMNVKGLVEWEGDMIKIHLNAVPNKYDDDYLLINMDAELANHVRIVRESTQKNITRLLHERGLSLRTIDDFARAVIDLWKGLSDGMEDKISVLPKWRKEEEVSEDDWEFCAGFEEKSKSVEEYWHEWGGAEGNWVHD